MKVKTNEAYSQFLFLTCICSNLRQLYLFENLFKFVSTYFLIYYLLSHFTIKKWCRSETVQVRILALTCTASDLHYFQNIFQLK